MANNITRIPKYGFRVKLDHVFPEKWTQNLVPRLNQIWGMITLGVPLGGIGSGTIGRGFKGEFCRFQLRPGVYQYKIKYGNQFVLTVKNKSGVTVFQTVLNCGGHPKSCLQSWDWTFQGTNAEYVGLYPRAWTVFDISEQKLKLTCRQVSPVIPHNYKDSCVPGSVFIWDIENLSNESKIISITFTFQNGIGEKGDKDGGCWSQVFKESVTNGSVFGVLINHAISKMRYTFGISAREKDDVRVTCLRNWNPKGSNKEIWEQMNQGRFPPGEIQPSPQTSKGEELASAVCAQTTVEGNSVGKLEFSLVWDMPEINFGENQKRYRKYYTRYFGCEGCAPKLSVYCHENYPRWEEEIHNWQEPILTQPDLPDWYKSALFNETYFLSDGGSVWLELDKEEKRELPPNDPRREYGRFAYLEGHEYRMYNTYDVHFYASFTLAMLWPNLQASVQRDFCDTIRKEDRSRQWHLFNGDIGYRKVKMSMPHDLGDPCEEPFLKINAYPVHDVSEWRDLDLKFVLQSYRDYSITGDLEQIKYLWENICLLMDGALRWDKDGDGLIENQGLPDQTYDTWTMTGPSSYCGTLWLAALESTCQLAIVLRDTDNLNKFSSILFRAKKAFDAKLWNGKYYNFDCSVKRSKTIMSDQLCGLWYLECSGLKNKILPTANVLSSLRTIYENNVMKYKDGEMGAVNGMLPNGKVDFCTLQSEEIWIGVVYALASLMIHKDMVQEGWKTAGGIYDTVYNKIGMGFETPEALSDGRRYRAIGYMRPLSIWSIQLAWEMRNRRSEGN
ncbi:hypothetical protein RUM44_005643 [Polyplax serrata]|uniref:Non-lysosomal glucosylceramidase n=1 Tax=Polyplax serrata TaxID=468196 RepID=A0ABR1ADY6_POLSC